MPTEWSIVNSFNLSTNRFCGREFVSIYLKSCASSESLIDLINLKWMGQQNARFSKYKTSLLIQLNWGDTKPFIVIKHNGS